MKEGIQLYYNDQLGGRSPRGSERNLKDRKKREEGWRWATREERERERGGGGMLLDSRGVH